jgi:hypothetical protein
MCWGEVPIEGYRPNCARFFGEAECKKLNAKRPEGARWFVGLLKTCDVSSGLLRHTSFDPH